VSFNPQQLERPKAIQSTSGRGLARTMAISQVEISVLRRRTLTLMLVSHVISTSRKLRLEQPLVQPLVEPVYWHLRGL
jgi:hypothetical protein